LPAVPFFALLSAFAAVYLIGVLRSRFSRSVVFLGATVLLLVLFVPLLKNSIAHVRETAGPYTSSLARNWMLNHIKGSRVLVEVYGPRLPANEFKTFMVDETGHLVEAKILGSNAEPGWDAGRLQNLDDLRSRGIDYVLMTGYYQHFLDEKEKYSGQVQTYERLMNNSKIVYDIQSVPGVSRGPRVRILQLTR
jgi:hypothetical protein